MMKKCVLAVLLYITLCAAPLMSCGSGKQETNVTAAPKQEMVSAETTAAKTDYYAALGGGLDFGGDTFTVASYKNDSWNIYLSPETETGDVLNDAAYRRTLEVEEMLNIKVEIQCRDDYETAFKNLVLAGDGTAVDLIAFWAVGNRSSYITGNLVYDWKEVPYVDLDAAWYNQTANDAYSIAGKQYFAVSDLTFPVHQHFRILFNKDLMSDFNLEYPYESVYDGTWTYDKMLGYCKNVYSDLNGNGQADLPDRYGLVLNKAFASLFPANSGELPVSSTGEGFKFNLYSSRIANIVSSMVALKSNPDVYLNTQGNNDQYQIFRGGSALFETYGSDPGLLRDIEFDFGYLPYPKYDDTQKDYVVWSSGGLMAIPASAGNINFTGAVLEALSAASDKYVQNAFIEKYVENKILRDGDSQKIYGMMRERATYDLSYNIDPSGELGDYAYYSYFLGGNTADAASRWAAVQQKVETSFAELYKLASGG